MLFCRISTFVAASVLLAGQAVAQAESALPYTSFSFDLEPIEALPASQVFPDDLVDPVARDFLEAGPGYLPADFDTGVDSPPAWDTAEVRQEFLKLEALRSSFMNEDQVNAAIFEGSRCPIDMNNLYGNIPHPDDAEALWDVLTAASSEVSYFATRDALKFMRARPEQVSGTIQPFLKAPPLPAYPSVWSAETYAVAYVLVFLHPERYETYFGDADDMVKRRELAGLNLEMDNQAAKILAGKVIAELLEHPDLKPLLGQARQELVTYTSR